MPAFLPQSHENQVTEYPSWPCCAVAPYSFPHFRDDTAETQKGKVLLTEELEQEKKKKEIVVQSQFGRGVGVESMIAQVWRQVEIRTRTSSD